MKNARGAGVLAAVALAAVSWGFAFFNGLRAVPRFAGDAVIHLAIMERSAAGAWFEFNPNVHDAGSSSIVWTLAGAALIRKIDAAMLAGEREVVLWGDGSPTREFLYVEDCAEGLVLAAERYDRSEPVNLGAGFEISIRELAELIRRLMGYEGAFRWDTSQPNGQPRRRLDVTRAREWFGFAAQMPFEEGLRRTIDWWRAEGRQKYAGRP